MEPVRWGVLGCANIALRTVIPAMQQSALTPVAAIASRDGEKARAAAESLGIARAHASYEALLADDGVDAIYNPLPNNLHLEWSVKALEAGKHVLCEKPLTMDAGEAEELIRARDRTGLCAEEAMMARDHPQWAKVRELIDAGGIGALHAMQLAFTYNNPDPANIRNKVETGGGGIYDLGVYTSTIARLVFDDEPKRLVALVDDDPSFGTDRLASVMLDFGASRQACFTVGTQTGRYQQGQILGSDGWIRVEFPFAHIQPRTAYLHHCRSPGFDITRIEVPAVNQYTIQGERFSRLVRGEPTTERPLELAHAGMRVLDAIRRSHESGGWEDV
jgi:predicted dehydrogenase